MTILPASFPALASFEDLRDAGLFGSRSALRRAIDERNFPEPIRTSERSNRWARAEVEAWLEALR